MRRLATTFGAVGVAGIGLAACKDPLNAPNRNNPDVDRVFASPALIEQLISTTYQQVNQGLHGSSTALDPQLLVMSFESYGSVNNFGMGPRAALPRGLISNERNNLTASENLRDFSWMTRRSRESANGVQALDALVAGGGTLGSTARNQRARAFALFSNGVALGNLALAYDSAAIVTHLTPREEGGRPFVPELSAYADVMRAALAQLDSSIAVASRSDAAGGFPLPSTWINGNALSQADFIRFVRSYKARFRAGVARTPTERTAVDWNAVIADATNGITGDMVLQLSSGAGWNSAFKGQQVFADDSRGWHQMPPMIYGMADTSGAYAAWIATPIPQRTRFLIKTPDRRFPSGETRAEQQANSPANAAFAYNKYPYIRNRSGQDTPGEPFGNSFYDFYRFKSVHLNSGTGPWVVMAKAEMDMLAAEGYIRTNRLPEAAALIDVYRARAGLPTLGVVTSADQPVPGGAACVPRVPTSAGNTTTCGNVMEAMKWEKRMETAFTGYGQWFFDARGWGDLPEGNILNWPVPYQELDAREKPIYSLGGVGGKSAAGKGTYGF